MNPVSLENQPQTLEQLMLRGDVWRGDSGTSIACTARDTGYADLNSQLLHQGWPISSLIEICQQNLTHSEWLLMTPALLQTAGGFIVLLNPPALPFAQALLQAGLDLERILIVQASNKADFLASFFELSRAQACDAVLAWQPRQPLSYTELRKCLLAATDGKGLYVLFRPASMRQQSSPASLRLLTNLTSVYLQVTVFKQKGALQTCQAQPIELSLPAFWQAQIAHAQLGLETSDGPHTHSGTKPGKFRAAKSAKFTKVTPLRRGKS